MSNSDDDQGCGKGMPCSTKHALTQEDFKHIEHEPGCTCTHVELRSSCCFSEKVQVAYDTATGEMHILCANCKKLVARVAVAEGGEVLYRNARGYNA